MAAIALTLSACTGLRTRDQVNNKIPVITRPTPPAPMPSAPPQSTPAPIIVDNQPPMEPVSPSGEEGPHVEIPTPSAPPSQAIPKIGLILGPGGARAFAHIGVLQEFQREKIPVVAVAGIEWGAPIAALYAGKGLANEAEWQMSKLKADDVIKKSIIGGTSGKPGDIKSLNDFLRLAFAQGRAEGAKLPFACPAHNLEKNKVFVMSKGSFDQLLPYCMAYPPLFRPWQGNVAAVREVKLLADQLRARGATVIVLVNVLPFPSPARPVAGDEGSTEAVLWNEIASFYAKPISGVDYPLNVGAGAAVVTSFDSRRDIQAKGTESGAALVRQLAKRLGL